VRFEPLPEDPFPLAGVDVSYLEAGGAELALCAAVVVDAGMRVLEVRACAGRVRFPYVPGFLAFREVGLAFSCVRALSVGPRALLVDGAGVAHPRRAGFASHLGLLLDLPSVGVAKSRLVGRHHPVPRTRGSWVPLWLDEEVVGAVLRTRDEVRPLYVSVGHRATLRSALDLVLRCTGPFRVPEPLRVAHLLSERLKGEVLRGVEGLRPAEGFLVVK